MIVNIIVAREQSTYGIGCKNTIPWKNGNDMKWFKSMTTGHAVLMGWNTYESIGKALPNRFNIVVSKSHTSDDPDINIVDSVESGIKLAETEKYPDIFVIGGGSIYTYVLENDLADSVFIDDIAIPVDELKDTQFDTYFSLETNCKRYQMNDRWEYMHISDNEPNCHMYVYHRKRSKTNNVDNQYLKLLNTIKESGKLKHTRAGDAYSTFGHMLRFNMQDGLPILTTKKVFAKGCIHELLWFLSGNTNIKYLVENNVHIWDDDAYRHYLNVAKSLNITAMSKDDFLKKVLECEKLNDYTYGDLGPVYGKQWNNFGGVNQINTLINTLCNNPDDRRMMISAWNVGELSDMALPPCHYMSQWYTTEMTIDERIDEYRKQGGTEDIPEDSLVDNVVIDGKVLFNRTNAKNFLDEHNVPSRKLSLMWHQRSVDTCLGFPYDLLSYSILLSMVAQVVNMVPDEVLCTLGDTHIYCNQLEATETQLIRNPYKFDLPVLELNKNIKNIYDFKYNDIKINSYESYPSVKYTLSVGL